jgi:hypothetical protein
MNPQLQSFITSAVMFGATSLATFATSKGFISNSDQAGLVNALVSIGGYAVAGGMFYLKHRQNSASALTAAVNSDAVPGVKVVTVSSPSPPVNIDESGKIVKAPLTPSIVDHKGG